MDDDDGDVSSILMILVTTVKEVKMMVNYFHSPVFIRCLWGFYTNTPGPVRVVKTDILGTFGRCPAGCRKVTTGAGTVF